MKKVFLLLVTVVFMNCSTNEEVEVLQDATLIGRWNLEGFEGNVMYEFTAEKRFTLYAFDGNFESVEEIINSGLSGNDWWYEGADVTVDLNFGNFSTLKPTFKCNNNVIIWLDASAEVHSTFYREGYNLNDCTE